MEESGIQNADDECLRELHRMVETMKADQIAQVTKLDRGYVEEIFELLDKYSEKSDDELVEKLLTGKFSGEEDEQAVQ